MNQALRVGVAITHRDRLPSSSRYELLVKIASGGMATVYVGRLNTVIGTSRLVAIKRAHAHLLEDPAFSKMLIAEARLASRIHHPNVVAVQNVEELEGELLLVMDYVEGASLADLWSYEDVPLPARVAVRAVLDACAGLQAAHELTDDDGKLLGIVHRDVSPHNILLGVDGIARLTDFGIAKSSGGHTGSASQHTTTGALKGKVAYMAPEYVESGSLDARSDVFALGIVLWEALTRERLFRGGNEVESLRLILATKVPRPSEIAPWVGKALDDVVLKSLARSPNDRFATASEMADALEVAARREDLIATASQAGGYVKKAAGDALTRRRSLIRQRSDESMTANAATDPVTREKLASALAESDGNTRVTGTMEPAFARTEHTAPLTPRESATATAATSPSASDVRVRESATAIDSSVRLPDGATAGSGVSAGLVEDARRGARPRGKGWLVGVGVVLAGGIAAAAIVGMRASAPAPASASASASVSASPSAPASASASASASATATATAAASATATATPSEAAALVSSPPARPGRGKSVAAPARSTGSKPPAAPPELPADKAPPNPYAH